MSNNLVKFPQIRVKIAIENYSIKLLEEISEKLNNFIRGKIGEEIRLEFKSCEKYWKIPEFTMCYFDIFSKEIITVKEIIKGLDLQMHYSEGDYYTTHNSIDCHYTGENSVWSAFAFGEFFLHEKIRFFSIFTVSICTD